MYTIMSGLEYRQLHPELFQQGEYVQLECGGGKKQHLCAFARLYQRSGSCHRCPAARGYLEPGQQASAGRSFGVGGQLDRGPSLAHTESSFAIF